MAKFPTHIAHWGASPTTICQINISNNLPKSSICILHDSAAKELWKGFFDASQSITSSIPGVFGTL